MNTPIRKLRTFFKTAKRNGKRRGKKLVPADASSAADEAPASSHVHNLAHGFDLGHGLGIGLAAVGLAVEFKEGIAAIIEPFQGCGSLSAISWAAIQMPSATFAGVAFWIATLASSSIALVLYATGKIKLRYGTKSK